MIPPSAMPEPSLTTLDCTQLTDLGSQKVEIGMPVEMVTRRLRSDGDERGMIVYGYEFRPLMQ